MVRPRTVHILIGFLLILTLVLGYNYFFQPFAHLTQPVVSEEIIQPAVPSATPAGEVSVASIISGLTPEQRAAQLLAVPVVAPVSFASESASFSSPAAVVAALQPGFVTIFGENITSQTTSDLIAALETTAATTVYGPEQQPLTIQPAMVVDHEGGTVQRLSGAGFTQLPSWQALCQLEQASRSALLRRSSLELQAVGIDIVLAPVLDTAAQNQVLRTRICDGDPAVVAARAQEFVALFQLAEITPVVKHFPGLGQTTRDLHFGYQSIEPNQAELNVFRNLMDAYPTIGVMSSFVGVTVQDPSTPCALSSSCVGQLAGEYPQALLVSDALDMVAAGNRQASGSATLAERAESALRAGNHVLLFGPGVSSTQLESVIAALVAAQQADPAFEMQLSQHLLHVLEYKQQRGLVVP